MTTRDKDSSSSSELNCRAIRQRAAQATPGPWRRLGRQVKREGDGFAMLKPIVDHCKGEHDAEFIAHARTDIPFLLAENDQLRARLALLEAQIEQASAVRDSIVAWCGPDEPLMIADVCEWREGLDAALAVPSPVASQEPTP